MTHCDLFVCSAEALNYVYMQSGSAGTEGAGSREVSGDTVRESDGEEECV